MGRPKVLVSVNRALLKRISEPEDLEKLKSFSEVYLNPWNRDLSEEELARLIRGVDGCITSWGSPKITGKVLEEAEKLKIIGHAAGSIKPYVSEEAFKRGIVVVNAASTIAVSVAEYTLALILNCLRRIPDYVASMRKVGWNARKLVSSHTADLQGKTVGLIGLGCVARELVRLLRPFGVKVLAYDPYAPRETAGDLGVELVALGEVLSKSDIVSIHAALTEETRHMIGEGELRLMKSSAYLINTARGAIVDTGALIKALRGGWIAGAALDVFEEEPLPDDSPLYELDNIYLTPHVAGPSEERRRKLFGTIVEDFRRFFSGEKPINVVYLNELTYRA